LWEQYKRIIKDNGAIVLTASQPFTSALVMSNPKMFKYEWIWDKKLSTGFLNANRRPLVRHESVLVFGNSKLFNKQFTFGEPYGKRSRKKTEERQYGAFGELDKNNTDGKRNPTSILEISNAKRTKNGHPTQKPVALFEYLIKTYTSFGDTILDNCSGSGTTAVSADNLGRNWICIEKDEHYYAISKKRINENRARLNLLSID
jgi:site-specific DNA-methyltransferase (adenine-specific)